MFNYKEVIFDYLGKLMAWKTPRLETWYITNNPNLEDRSPEWWVLRGEGAKILKFIRNN